MAKECEICGGIESKTRPFGKTFVKLCVFCEKAKRAANHLKKNGRYDPEAEFWNAVITKTISNLTTGQPMRRGRM